jgi:hypothetical protein
MSRKNRCYIFSQGCLKCKQELFDKMPTLIVYFVNKINFDKKYYNKIRIKLVKTHFLFTLHFSVTWCGLNAHNGNDWHADLVT